MSFDLTNFNDPTLDEDYVAYLVGQESLDAYLHFSRLWTTSAIPSPRRGVNCRRAERQQRPYIQAQEMGLPPASPGAADRRRRDAAHQLSAKEVRHRE